MFDMIGQMLRNAVEHGIESPERRTAIKKPEQGTLVVEFVDRRERRLRTQRAGRWRRPRLREA